MSDVTAICSRVRREVRHRLPDRLPTTSYRNQRRERLVDQNQFVGRFGMSRSSQVGGLSPQHEVADPKPRHSPRWGFILHDLVRGVRVVVPCADWTINRTGFVNANAQGRRDLFPAGLCGRVGLRTDQGTLGGAPFRSHGGNAIGSGHHADCDGRCSTMGHSTVSRASNAPCDDLDGSDCDWITVSR